MRSAPLKRTSLRPRAPRSEQQRGPDRLRSVPTVTPGAFRAPQPVATTSAEPVTKDAPVRSEAYRRAVATLPCAICGAPGYSQAAHANTGKGMGMKACDLTCFPACGPRPGFQGCHAALDQGALFLKAVRRELEPAWAADTQRRLLTMGLVPASLIDSISTALQGATN